MTSRTFLHLACICSLALGLASCLRGEKVEYTPDHCSCTGTICLDGKVSLRSPTRDDGEGDNPCLTCEYTSLGTCVEGCTTETKSVPGCSVAYACKTWERVLPGASCAKDRDCEPGSIGGSAANTLACINAVCTDVGAAKFQEVAVTACTRETFGASSACDGRACLGQDDTSTSYTCSPARCIQDSDCPAQWHCRCAEEYTNDGLRGWRWCVPDVAGPDAGS